MDLGFERAGLECRFQVEVDDYCRQVLRRHWPDVPQFADIREVRGADLPPALRSVDVLVGGFPCQDVSSAGKKVGLDGERSGLWREFYRLICELRPQYAVIENVGALRFRGRGLHRVLRDLAEAGLAAQWIHLRASDFGAPHQRERIFIVAHAQCERLGHGFYPQLFQGDHHQKSPFWASSEPLVPVEAVGRAYSGIPGHLRVDDGPAAGLDVTYWQQLGSSPLGTPERELGRQRVKAAGNAVVPIKAEYVARCLLDFHQTLTAFQTSEMNRIL